MTSFIDALGDLIGLTEPHLDEYDGEEFVTPSLIDHDDGKDPLHERDSMPRL